MDRTVFTAPRWGSLTDLRCGAIDSEACGMLLEPALGTSEAHIRSRPEQCFFAVRSCDRSRFHDESLESAFPDPVRAGPSWHYGGSWPSRRAPADPGGLQ